MYLESVNNYKGMAEFLKIMYFVGTPNIVLLATGRIHKRKYKRILNNLTKKQQENKRTNR